MLSISLSISSLKIILKPIFVKKKKRKKSTDLSFITKDFD